MNIYFISLSLILSQTSCATLFGNNTRTIQINSQPSEARILVNGSPQGRTPGIATVPSSESGNIISVSKDGYETESRPVSSSVQGIAFLNLFNILAWAIDLATGNIKKINEKEMSFELKQKSTQPNT